METVSWIILISSLVALDSAQVLKKCSTPAEYPHTRLDKKFLNRQRFSSGEKVYYNCAEEFTPSKGSRSVECKNGVWSKLTLKCEKRSCGNAGDLPNGQFHYEGNSLIGEKVYAVCNDGYTLKGLNYMICKKSGWTGEFPSCVEGETTCFAPVVANSVHSGENVTAHRLGDNMTFTCNQGFQLDGAQLITCGTDGQWQPQPPQCLLSPDETQPSSGSDTGACGKPPAVRNSNANLADKYITKTSFASGDKVYYNCDIGYVPAGGSRVRLCNNGKWTPLKLKCERWLCGSAGEILNGQFIYSGVQFGDVATAVCDEGYILVGRPTRNCMSKGWDGRVPVCEVVVCDDPPEVKNAEIKGLQEPPYTYRSVVRYQCGVGTLVGQKEIWCTKNGTWSEPSPECKEITCPSPKVANAYWTGSHSEMHQYRDTISIACKWGYVLIGPRSVTCNRNGWWEPGLPKCHRTSRRAWRS